MSGIYSILNKRNGKIYVGQSVDCSRRLRHHRNHLRKNTHHNQHLQSSWNKYGEDAFLFGMLESCPNEKLNENEVWWINYFDSTDSEKGYNLEEGGISDYKMSDEVKEKISTSHKGRPNTISHKLSTSKTLTSTGIFRVSKHFSSRYKQGYCWRYQYYENGKRKVISNIDLDKLKEVVISKGLSWYEFSTNEEDSKCQS